MWFFFFAFFFSSLSFLFKQSGNMGPAIKTVGLIFTRKKIERSSFIGLEDYAM
jgi:hypothetical protein